MKDSIKKTHEIYHQSTRSSSKIIKDNNFTYRHLISVINKFLHKDKKDILDIGCGAGSISFYLASKGYNVTGIDISQNAISSCRDSAKKMKLKNTKFIQGIFPDEININRKFDAVIFTEVIEHLENDASALSKINELLIPNGILILSTPSINAPLHKLGLTKKFDKEVGHLRRYSMPQLKTLLKKNNFKISKTVRTEGILRNFLFVNPYTGKLVRYVNFFASDFVTFLDNISLKLFGESNYIIVARKK